jgi:hypothetical protein
MFINHDAKLLHIVRFRGEPLMYMTTTDDAELSERMINEELRNGSFQNQAFQMAYEGKKAELGLLNPHPGELLTHQFVSTVGLSGFGTGHWLLRDLIGNKYGLRLVANIGDWLDVEGFIDVTPPDQDARRYLRVTDVGKYYDSINCFEKGSYPIYILACENNQIVANSSVENHRDEQPKGVGYDQVTYKGDDGRTVLLSHSNVSIDLTDDEEQLIKDKPLHANGRLYSSIAQFAMARNIPTWFVLGQVQAPASERYAYAQDWRFV